MRAATCLAQAEGKERPVLRRGFGCGRGRRGEGSLSLLVPFFCDGGDRGGRGWYEGSRILLLCLMLGFAFDVRALVRWCWFSYQFVAGERGWVCFVCFVSRILSMGE